VVNDRTSTSGDVVLECTGLHKTFGALTAVRDVNLSLRRGHILGLVGPNGAGKTTLLRMLTTLLRPTRGNVRIFGHDTRAEPLAVRRQIGYLPDFFNLHRDLTLAECLRFFAYAYDIPPADIPQRVHDALAATALLDKRDNLVQHLSRGMVQRLGMAMLMVRDAEILILDEPASGLDPGARVQFRQMLRDLGRQGKAILISSHILSELEDTCTHVAVMDRSLLLEMGTFDDIRRRTFSRLRYRIRVLGDMAAAQAAATHAGATLTPAEPGVLTVDAADEEDVARTNAALVAAGVPVVEIRLLSDLENAYVRITTGGGVDHGTR